MFVTGHTKFRKRFRISPSSRAISGPPGPNQPLPCMGYLENGWKTVWYKYCGAAFAAPVSPTSPHSHYSCSWHCLRYIGPKITEIFLLLVRSVLPQGNCRMKILGLLCILVSPRFLSNLWISHLTVLLKLMCCALEEEVLVLCSSRSCGVAPQAYGTFSTCQSPGWFGGTVVGPH